MNPTDAKPINWRSFKESIGYQWEKLDRETGNSIYMGTLYFGFDVDTPKFGCVISVLGESAKTPSEVAGVSLQGRCEQMATFDIEFANAIQKYRDALKPVRTVRQECNDAIVKTWNKWSPFGWFSAIEVQSQRKWRAEKLTPVWRDWLYTVTEGEKTRVKNMRDQATVRLKILEPKVRVLKEAEESDERLESEMKQLRTLLKNTNPGAII